VSADVHEKPMWCVKRFSLPPHGQGEHVSPLGTHPKPESLKALHLTLGPFNNE